MPTIARSQQENLISILAHSAQHGRLVSAIVEPGLFEGDYQVAAVRLIEYWKRHGTAPGIHTADLFADILDDPANRKGQTYRHMLLSMAALHDAGINTDYVVGQLREFLRLQTLRDAIYRAAQLLNQPTTEAITQVESILGSLNDARSFQFDPGTRLDEIDSLIAYLQHHHGEFVTGIAPLDSRGIVPARGTVFLFLGGKGKGKTWFLINCGRRALQMRKKVLHVSLENSEVETKMRYWQALFALPRRPLNENDTVEQTVLDIEYSRRGVPAYHGTTRVQVPVQFDFQSPELRLELETRIGILEARYAGINLYIKRFANRTLTIEMLESYLQMLEITHNFIPDIMLLDYVKLMKVDMRDARRSIGNNMELVRALAVKRNMAIVTADQFNRQGHLAKQGRSTHVGEDWSQIHTADVCITHSATDKEFERGLARLYVEHARTERDKFGILLTQNYNTGQYVLQSVLLPPAYLDAMMSGEEEEEQTEESDEVEEVDAAE